MKRTSFSLKKMKKRPIFPLVRRKRRIFALRNTRLLMNLQTEQLVGSIQAGIEEKKGRDIVVADFSNIAEAICQAFVICTGNSPSHLQALTDSVEEFARKGVGARPAAIAGLRNAQWVAMDYGTVIVHLFLKEARDFYDLEHLWADAVITEIPNLD